jgi:hypothetical protein
VDLRVVPPDAWGAAMQYFTGAKAHNIRTREIAVHRKLKLSEYGLFDAVTDELIVSKTEEEVYHRLGLPWIPPTLREDIGEIEAALAGELPDLVTEDDVRGDLHTHTKLTDGLASLEEMVAAAAERGYAYYAVTDHGPKLYMQQMTLDKALAQRERVRELDGANGLRLLHGIELNIDADGDVDWPPDVLAGFDVCVAGPDDQAAGTRRRAPVRQHHRPSRCPADRPPPADRRRLGPGLSRLRPLRDRAGDQRLPRPPRPGRRAHPAGPAVRGEIRRRQRLPRGRPPGQPPLRHRHGATRLAQRRRRDQHLAAGPAHRLPAEAGGGHGFRIGPGAVMTGPPERGLSPA